MSGITAVEQPRSQPLVDWRAIIAGAAVASGVSITLLAFGSAIGLSVASTAPTWRDSSPWLWVLSGMFLLFVAISSFGAGGYVAGRMQALSRLSLVSESEFRDGMHGVVTWGLSLTLTALLALGGVAAASRAAGSSGGALGPTASATGESTIAAELDALYRGDHGTTDTTIAYRRAEAARILLRSSGHAGISSDDRSYLAEIVRGQTGIAALPAAERVNRVIADVKQELHRARQAAVMQAFLAAAALMIGLAVAWCTAVEGGREYERKTVPLLYRSFD